MKAKKLLVLVLILTHLSALLLEVSPLMNGRNHPLKRVLSAYLQTTGLWQDWSMFSPDPLGINLHVEAKVRYRDGREASYTLPRLHLLSQMDRILMERYRKWVVDWLRVDGNSHLWSGATRFILKNLPSSPDNPVVSIRLVRYWHQIEDPRIHFRKWGYRIPDSELNGSEFHSQKVPLISGGLK
jgi:hypothetical protein